MRKKCKAIFLLSLSLLLGMPHQVLAEDDGSDDITFVNAGTDDESTYYTNGETNVKDLYTTDISDLTNSLAWVTNKTSSTVVREFKDGHTQVYVNVPNLQLALWTVIYRQLPQGFSGNTYNVDDTQKLVDVGSKADTTSAMTMFGFHIPSNEYIGEYPLVSMSYQGTSLAGQTIDSITSKNKTVYGASNTDSALSSVEQGMSYITSYIKTGGNIIAGYFSGMMDGIGALLHGEGLSGLWNKFLAGIGSARLVEAPSPVNYGTIAYANKNYYNYTDSQYVNFFQQYFYKYFVENIDQSDISAQEMAEKLSNNDTDIPLQAEDGKIAWGQKLSDINNVTVAQLYVTSGLFQQSPKSSTYGYSVLAAVRALAKDTNEAQSMLNVLITKICFYALQDGEKLAFGNDIVSSSRLMPYDINTLSSTDKTAIGIADHRVSLYTNNLYSFLVNGNMGTFSNRGIIESISLGIVNLVGWISEITIWLNHICDFSIFDNTVLSPSVMWSNPITTLIITAFVIVVLLMLVKKIIDYFLKINFFSIWQFIVHFMGYFFVLSLLLAISISPAGVWGTIENTMTTVMNAGETFVSGAISNTNVNVLYGNSKRSDVMYWLPYFDTWTQFNTGYGLLDEHQTIKNDGQLETQDYDAVNINGTDANIWSVLLADSFQSSSAEAIQGNAYRVVDHFMAPRLTVEQVSNGYKIANSMNENYNGQFQKSMVFDKLLISILLLFIMILKVVTFFWLWYRLYLFFFRVLLSTADSDKTFSKVLLETFSPLGAILVLGAYSGICIWFGLNISGIAGFIVTVGLYFTTAGLIRAWHDTLGGAAFPKPLNFIYDSIAKQRNFHTRTNKADSVHVDLTNAQVSQLEKETGLTESQITTANNFKNTSTKSIAKQKFKSADDSTYKLTHSQTSKLNAMRREAYDTDQAKGYYADKLHQSGLSSKEMDKATSVKDAKRIYEKITASHIVETTEEKQDYKNKHGNLKQGEKEQNRYDYSKESYKGSSKKH